MMLCQRKQNLIYIVESSKKWIRQTGSNLNFCLDLFVVLLLFCFVVPSVVGWCICSTFEGCKTCMGVYLALNYIPVLV